MKCFLLSILTQTEIMSLSTTTTNTKKTQLLKHNLCSYGRNDYHIRSNINWSKVSQLFSFPGQYVLFVLGTFVSIYHNIIANLNERITFKMSDLKWLIF